MIRKFQDFKNESNAIEGLTEYELQIKNIYSDFKKGIGNGTLDLGKVTDVSKIDISNIQKTYPKSKIVQKDGRYLLIIKENPIHESSKISNALIEMFEIISDELKDKLNQETIEKSVIDKTAKEFLPQSSYEFYKDSKELIYNMIENNFLVNVNESKEEIEEIFDRDDDYDKENLKRGEKIQKEHKPTYKKIKKFLELTGELPPKEEFYKSITKDHMDKPEGVGELYYDEEKGLENFEKELKDEWKEKQGKDDIDDVDDVDDVDDKTGKKYDENGENLIVQTESIKIKKFSEIIETKKQPFFLSKKINETVNLKTVDDLMQQIRDRFTQDEIFNMIENNKENYDNPESQTISDIINSVSNGNISIDDYSELSNQIASEFDL